MVARGWFLLPALATVRTVPALPPGFAAPPPTPPSTAAAPAPPAPRPPAVQLPSAAPTGIAHHSFAWRRTATGGQVLALTVEPSPGWHVYWQNPGDSGDCPSIELTLPPGMEAASIIYPRPEVGLVDGAPFYGYNGPVTYLLPIRPSAAPLDERPVLTCGNGPWSAVAKVMACKDRCTVTTLTARGNWPEPMDGEPLQLEGGSVGGASLPIAAAAADVNASVDAGRVTVEGPARGMASARFIPASVPGMQVVLPEGAAAAEGRVEGDRFRIEFELASPGTGAGQPALDGLVLLGNRPGDPCVRLVLPPPPPSPAPRAPAPAAPARGAPARPASAPPVPASAPAKPAK